MMARKKGLGKGLDALFIDNDTEAGKPVSLPVQDLTPNKNQPRKNFDMDSLTALADSIREHGLIQPLVVRPQADGSYQIIAGERRYRAARMLGLTEVPVVVREMEEQEVMEIALIENLQREDLNPVEEAMGYEELLNRYGLTQEKVAQRVGKSRSAIANALRLLSLPKIALNALENGELSVGQGKAILSFDEDQMEEVTALTLQKGLTVRALEKLAAQQKKEKKAFGEKKAVFDDSFYTEMAIALESTLHRKVKIEHSGEEKGKLVIDFYSKDELKEIGKKLAEMEEMENA